MKGNMIFGFVSGFVVGAILNWTGIMNLPFWESMGYSILVGLILGGISLLFTKLFRRLKGT